MKLFEIAPRARGLKAYGWGTREYHTPFPIEHIDEDLSLLYIGIKKRLLQAPVRPMKLDSLIAIQTSVFKPVVSMYKKTTDVVPISVARINGKNYIIDGTHRATAAWAQRKDEINAHFLEYKDLDVNQYFASRTTKEWNDILDKAQV